MGVRKGPYEALQITRRFAARSQIETSIDLFLRHSDYISAHVLAWSAVEMLRGIAKTQGKETFHERLEDHIRSEYLKDWRDHLKSHYNWAKHADRDPERILDDFRPETTSWTLFAACLDYSEIYSQRTWTMFVFHHWFLCRNPKIAGGPLEQFIPKIAETFGNPEAKQLCNSSREALEMIGHGVRHLGLFEERLGENWRGAIEP